MAIGLGRLFGIELPQNFNSPYKATSPSDFWRRWHMTLSQWLRDYLYIPLGGNRCSPARQRFNLMTTMVLGGLWRRANWTFAAWGTWHGLLLVGHHACPAWDRRLSPRGQRNATFLLVTIGWVFFRSETFDHAGHGSGASPARTGSRRRGRARRSRSPRWWPSASCSSASARTASSCRSTAWGACRRSASPPPPRWRC